MAKQQPKNIIQEGGEPSFSFDELRAYAGPIRQQLENAIEYRNSILKRHREELVDIDRQLEKMVSVLEFLGETNIPNPTLVTSKGRPTKKKKAFAPWTGVTRAGGTPTGFGITLESCYEMAQGILTLVEKKKENGEDPVFTQKDAYRAIDWDQSKGSQAFRYLAHINFLGQTARDSKTRAQLWEVVDASAVDKEFEAADKKTQDWMEEHGRPTSEAS